MGECILESGQAKQKIVVSRLSSLRQSISLMSPTYPPASLISDVMDGYIDSINQQSEAENVELNANISLQTDPTGERPMLTQAGTGAVTEGPEQLRKRGRRVNPFSFTPTEPASHAVQGLPFLPPSFLEGLSADDLVLPDQMGYSDYGFAWDADDTPMYEKQTD